MAVGGGRRGRPRRMDVPDAVGIASGVATGAVAVPVLAYVGLAVGKIAEDMGDAIERSTHKMHAPEALGYVGQLFDVLGDVLYVAMPLGGLAIGTYIAVRVGRETTRRLR